MFVTFYAQKGMHKVYGMYARISIQRRGDCYRGIAELSCLSFGRKLNEIDVVTFD